MTFRMQKILVVTGFILVVVAFALGLYFVFFKAPTGPEEVSPTITEEGTEPGALPGTTEAGDRTLITPGEGELPTPEPSPVAIGGPTEVGALTLTGVTNPSLGADGRSLNFYDPADGKFYAVDKDGNRFALLPTEYPDVDNVVWSPDGRNAVVEFPDGANIVVDFATGDTHTLPQHWEDFDFSPTGEQLISKSIGVDPGNRWLVISNPDGSGADTIAALGRNADKVQVSWSPNDQVVAFSDTGALTSGFGRKQMLAIGKNQENFPGIVVEGFSFEPKWSEDGSRLLYSTHGPSSNYQPQLWLVDAQSDTLGENRRSVALNTWADKCTYSNATIVYCAVPQSLPEGSGLQRALAFGKPDTIYRVDTDTGMTVVVGTPENPTSMSNLNVSDDGRTLFYQNVLTGTLQQIQVK
ncbi:hypothetical protein HOI83_04600 [Candidatus Uhrbacteria bacterium]|jgi:hypothetical protein|nr:hypothetical protein [Candidatus Uhrbacteria bacterium]